jgi:hypothetical protein
MLTLLLLIPGQVALPQTVKIYPGKMIKIPVQAVSPIKWVCPPGADILPVENGRSIVFVATRPGIYQIAAYTAVGGKPTDPSLCTVVVEGPTLGTPAPSTPVPLKNKLLVAWSAESAADRRVLRTKLAGVLRRVAAAAEEDRDLKSWGDLGDRTGQMIQEAGIGHCLPQIQKVLQLEVRARFPKGYATDLDRAGRNLAASTYREMAQCLEQLP